MSKHPTKKPTSDDVARLVEGKPSVNQVGSQGIPHRLRNDERKKLEIATERGFLLISDTTRSALINSWLMTCKAKNMSCSLLERSAEGERHFQISDELPDDGE